MSEVKFCVNAALPAANNNATQQQIIRVRHEATTARLRSEEHEPLARAQALSLSEPDEASPFPTIGSRFLHFQLDEELGRGAFARVYLARQEALANRLVVLKVSTVHTDEPQTLARLRHTNIVPVYSVHNSGAVQVVCMPYLGRMTLEQVIAGAMAWRQAPPENGEALLSPLGTVVPSHELHRLSYVEGCLWVIGHLAAGLAHAHSRGVLHQDLKPANVLFTEDGVPMILDFNVASDGSSPSHEVRIGGTLPYMSPEHLRQFLDDDASVDERSDLFSLGVILYQLLTGQLPFPMPDLPNRDEKIRWMINQRSTIPAPLCRRNSAATAAVEAIVRKLLNPLPGDRYPSAEALREDISRQLSHRTLLHAPDRSLREGMWKWRKRHPRVATGVIAAITVLAALIHPAAFFAANESQAAERERQRQKAEAALDADIVIATLHRASIELGSPGEPLARSQGLRAAREMIEQYKVGDPQWKERPGFALLESAKQHDLVAAFVEILILLTRVEAASGEYSHEAILAAMRWNSIARSLLPEDDRPAVLERQRIELVSRVNGNARGPEPGKEQKLPERDIDCYFDGLDLTAAGYYWQALPRLARYCDHRPQDFRASLARGLCHLALGQADDAAAAFGICVALQPDSTAAIANRGKARLDQRRFQEAERDFNRALQLQPGWTQALMNRGIARLEQQRYEQSISDFSAALADPAAPTQLFFLRSRARLLAGDKPGSQDDYQEGLNREPRDARSWVERGRWVMEKEPLKALADFDAALKIDPTHRDALAEKAAVLGNSLNRESEAIPILDRLLELYPWDVESVVNRGVYLARLGRVADARLDAAAALAADGCAHRKYQVAGLFAQLSRHQPEARAEALNMLALAFRGGFDNMKLLGEDRNLDPIRADPKFQRLEEILGQFSLHIK